MVVILPHKIVCSGVDAGRDTSWHPPSRLATDCHRGRRETRGTGGGRNRSRGGLHAKHDTPGENGGLSTVVRGDVCLGGIDVNVGLTNSFAAR